LGDLSFRAVETLKTVGMAACEDTRRTLKLLNHLGIRLPLLSCRSHNEESAGAKVVAALDQNRDVAYLSDAGTPGLSDPGSVLVRKAAAAGHRILPIPGPSAFASLVSVAGAADKTIIFEGFLSPKAGRRRTRLRELLDSGAAFVLYESPFRILKLFQDLAEFDDSRYVCLGREMTKLHEEYLRGTAGEIFAALAQNSEKKGEFSLYVSGQKGKQGVD
jgi:16S rRNA (cytidine1402-2'-O)-methyltransferase